MSSEDLWDDPLQCPVPRLLGYPLMDHVSQVSCIIGVWGRVVKRGGGICESSETLVLFFRHVIEKAVIIGSWEECPMSGHIILSEKVLYPI